MGLPKAIAEFIFFENSFRPLKGDFCFIGRQTTYVTQKEIESLCLKYRHNVPKNFKFKKDHETQAAKLCKDPLINDKSFVSIFSANFKSIDVSKYEKADIILDLSKKIPEKYHEKFDVIYNGSCLDNIFNPATALQNISRLLKPGGRAILLEHGSMFNGPYTVFSPGWFFDFFCANQYLDVKVYLALVYDGNHLHFGAWDLYFYDFLKDMGGKTPVIFPKLFKNPNHIMILTVCEKGPSSTNEVCPIQFQYRDAKINQKEFYNNSKTILNSKRPIFNSLAFKNPRLRKYIKSFKKRFPLVPWPQSEGFVHCGKIGARI